MALGPVQLLVLGFDEPNFNGEIVAELKRLRESDVVRLVDLLVVRRDENGELETLQHSDLSPEEAAELGAYAGALIGLGAAGLDGLEPGAAEAAAEVMAADGHLISEDDFWYAEDSIPNGSAAAVVLLEHRWAIGLRDAIVGAGGVSLADAWVHPTDLVSLGLEAAEAA